MKNSLIILNPAARSEKAARLHDRLREVCTGASIRETTMPGDAERVARAAVEEGYTAIIAAGGDGTVNEVVNGIVSAGSPETVLGILPVGTMNVFAVELGIPLNSLEKAWEVIRSGSVRRLDLPLCKTPEFTRCFVQLAGAGLDAEVVRRTTRESKKALGPLSYLLSLAQIAGQKPSPITLRSDDGKERVGSFVLLGNGRFYGGPFKMFRKGSPIDGLLDVLVFRNQSPWDLLRYMHAILVGQQEELSDVEYFQTGEISLSSEGIVPFELDGEMSGYLPVNFSVKSVALPVFAPLIA
jgi:YegS/Rv2252/BmrU family lipid kinase